jgi:hypothetical protein
MSGLLSKLRGRVAQARRSALSCLPGILMLNHNGAVSDERRVVVVTYGP